VVFRRRRSSWRFLIGPLAFDAFVVLMLVVDHLARVEWRDPLVPVIAVLVVLRPRRARAGH